MAHAGDTDRLPRLLAIALYFASRGAPLSSDGYRTRFYADTEQSDAALKKMVSRDRATLASVGLAITYDPSHDIYSAQIPNRPVPHLSPERQNTLEAALWAAHRDPSFPLPEPLDFVLQRIVALTHEDFDETRITTALTTPETASTQQRCLSTILGALIRQRCVSFYYRSANGHRARRTVGPRGIDFNGGQWYLYADDELSGELRTFSFASMDEAVIEKEAAPVPDDYRVTTDCRPPYQWGEDALHEVTLHIPHAAEARIRARANGDGTFFTDANGTLTWTITYNDLDRLCALVIREQLTFAPNATLERHYLRTTYLGRVVNRHAAPLR